MLPDFTPEGMLPPGDHELTIDGLKASMLVFGPGASHPQWDRQWRERLVENLGVLVSQLWQVGVTEIFADGSFTEDKDRPNDIDGYFVCDKSELASGMLASKLNRLDPHQVWTWDLARRTPDHHQKFQLPMWHRYHVELYPHWGYGQSSGIPDEFGNELEFPAAFRRSRSNGIPRGIVKIRRPP